jgi:hypothetical protein
MGSIASVPLIGTVMAAGPHQANNVPALEGSHNSVVTPTHEFAGNLDERLDFPADWKVDVMDMAGHNSPVLTEQQIGAKLAQPIGTKSLRELAAGMKIQEKTTGGRIAGNREIKMGQESFAPRRMKLN